MLLRRIVQHNTPALITSPLVVAAHNKRSKLSIPYGTPTTRRWTSSTAVAVKPGHATDSGSKRNPNEGILDMLRAELQEEERKVHPNTFRINAFARAIDVISRIGVAIKSGDDYVLEVQGIGIGIKNRINQYFVQQDLEAAYNEEQRNDALKRAAVMDLQKVPGIGRVKAQALADAGCRDLRALLASDKYHAMLTPQQVIRLKYVRHLEQTTTRGQAESILDAVVKCLPAPYEAVLVGEYRRGISDIQNLDIMLLHRDFVHVPMPTEPPDFPIPSSPTPPTDSFEPFYDSAQTPSDPSSFTPSSSSPFPSSSSSSPNLDPNPSAPTPKRKSKHIIKKRERTTGLTKAARQASLLHTEVIPCLKSKDVMCETLGETVHTWTGVVRVPPTSSQDGGQEGGGSGSGEGESGSGREEEPHVALSLQTPVGVGYRRVTFHLVPQKSRPTALLALTGDDELNRHMRKKAERQGMLLNEYGLWKWNSTDTQSSSESLENTSPQEEGEVQRESVVADDEPSPAGYWGLVQTPTEADVFKELGMRYVPPEKRNWGFVSGSAKLRPTRKKFSTSFVGS